MKSYIQTALTLLSCFLFLGAVTTLAQVKPNSQLYPDLATQTLNPVSAAYGSIYKNSVRTWVPSKPLLDPYDVVSKKRTVKEVKLSVQYVDGLGRPLQNVNKKAALNGHDVVSPFVYDSMGRNAFSYLSYVSDSSDGSFQNDPFNRQAVFLKGIYNPANHANGERFFYSKTLYESSPLSRVTKTMAHGNSWVGNNKGVGVTYDVNKSSEVRLWSIKASADTLPKSTSAYAAGQLFKTITTDEHQKRMVEYKNKEGVVVLKKVEINPGANILVHTGWLCTYYVYDEFNVLRFVLQPRAVELIDGGWQLTTSIANELCFSYLYDNRLRNSVKKVPGAGKVYMVYDELDRLVMTQDSVLRAAGKWQVITYDAFSRSLRTYLWNNTSTRSYHESQAWNSISYPSLSGTYELLTETYYDNYSWTPGTGMSATLDTAQKRGVFLPPSDLTYPYARPVKADYAVKGRVTGTKVKVLGTASTYLFTVQFYDEKGRVIQTQSSNITNGKDIVTSQYSFDGKLLISKQEHNATNMLPAKTTVIARNTYDDLDRPIRNTQQVNSGREKTVSEQEYDLLGNLSMKKLGCNPGDTTKPLETLDFKYNIRGWLAGINKDYASGGGNDHYFGMQLHYDYGFTASQFNGNIAGITWRGKSDGEQRAYGMSYDAANRLLKADFTQKSDLVWDQSDDLNFNVTLGLTGNDYASAYDANGNIKQMQQWGWKGAASARIDSLSYSYLTSGNRLASVKDNGVSTAGFALGDFKDGINTDDDYSYDGNGNLVLDKNKQISSISYNFLNLPSVITVTGKGTISYVYDAGGNKIKKTTVDAVSGVTTTTTYLSGFVYEHTSVTGTNQLQYFGHGEGRVRQGNGGYVYDYFIKDHLGNVRSVITEEVRRQVYPAATLEGAIANSNSAVAYENQFYTIDPNNILGPVSGIPAYTNSNGIPDPNPNGQPTASSVKAYKLNGSATGKMGLGITLKVMSGDTLNIFGKSYWQTASNVNNPVNVESVLAGLLGGPTGIGGAHGVTASQLNSLAANAEGIAGFFAGRTVTPDVPRAYINYIFFDEQLKFAGSGFSPVKTSAGLKDHYIDASLQNILVPKSGYVYVYCSNDSPVEVYFDNLQVVHSKGALLEETHYYPFGLTMEGISSKAAMAVPQNRLKSNGKEEQRHEFSDGSGLELYDFHARMQDPQIGRWLNVDPKADLFTSFTPYNFCYNNPLVFIDPDGMAAKYNWDDGKYYDEGEEVSWDQVQQQYQFGVYAQSASVFLTSKYLDNSKKGLKNDHGENGALFQELNQMFKSPGVFSVWVVQAEDASDAANQIEMIDPKIDNIYISSHGGLKQSYFRLGSTKFDSEKMISESKELARIAKKLVYSPGPIFNYANVIVAACNTGVASFGGEKLMSALARKLNSCVFAPTSETNASDFNSNTKRSVIVGEGHWIKVTPSVELKIETLTNVYFDERARIHYNVN